MKLTLVAPGMETESGVLIRSGQAMHDLGLRVVMVTVEIMNGPPVRSR